MDKETILMGQISDLKIENQRLRSLNAKLLKEGVEQETRIQREQAANRALNASISTLEKKMKEKAEYITTLEKAVKLGK